MRTLTRRIQDGAFLPVAMALLSAAAHAGLISKANNTSNLNQGDSWVGGIVPGTADVGAWDSTVGANTVGIGGDMEWLGLLIDANHSGNIQVNGTNILTLGADGITIQPNITSTLYNGLRLGVDQTWQNGGGTTVYGSLLDMNGRTLTLTGSGAHQFKATITGGGRLIIPHNNTKFSNGTTASNTDVVVDGTLIMDVTAASAPRTKSLTLVGGNLTQSVSGNNMNDRFGPLTIRSGRSTVHGGVNSSRTALLDFDSLQRDPDGVVFFRGSSLGLNGLSPLVVNSANIRIATPPALVGAGGGPGTTTLSILAGAYGDIVSSGNGYGESGGFVTYDETYGVRVLDRNSEYTGALTDGQTQLDNVRLTNNTGTPATWTITQPTTVNSLFLGVSGPTNSGIAITGSGTLTLNSGMLAGNQVISTSTAGDRMVVSNEVLDLNGRQGVVLFNTLNSSSSGLGGGILEIHSRISNDGGNGVVFSGENGSCQLSGTLTNDYTGPTIVASGRLILFKTGGTPAIPGNLVIVGGGVLLKTGQLPDDADVYIHNGGYMVQAASFNSGSGSSDWYRDLYMPGGSYNSGASGTSSGNTTNRNVFLSGGLWTVTKGHRAETLGTVTLSGGRLVETGSGDSTSGGRHYAGGLAISNIAAGAYSPITINNATGSGQLAQLFLLGDVAFTGNAANTNTVLVAAGASGVSGRILLAGARTFDIGDGPAEADLTIGAALTNFGTTNGVLIKTGAGTLALTGGNGYTGGTVVSNGALQVLGTVAGAVTVEPGATLKGTGSIGGDVAFGSGAKLEPDASALSVGGSVTSAGGIVRIAEESPARIILSAAGGITGSFTTDLAAMKATVKNGATELWLEPAAKGTVIIIR